MVKGITKQAVLVRSPDPELFEQAIFIVRGERGDVTQEDILRQAREAAGHYVSGKTVWTMHSVLPVLLSKKVSFLVVV